jgi:excisionase family DNA binding protein
MGTKKIRRLLHPTKYVADITGVCDTVIRREVSAGRIAAVRIRNSIRIPEAELQRLIREGTTPRQ